MDFNWPVRLREVYANKPAAIKSLEANIVRNALKNWTSGMCPKSFTNVNAIVFLNTKIFLLHLLQFQLFY